MSSGQSVLRLYLKTYAVGKALHKILLLPPQKWQEQK